MLRDRDRHRSNKRDESSIMSGMSCSNLSVSPLDIKTQHIQHNERQSLVSRARRDVDESRDEVGASSTHIQLPRSSSHQVRKEQERQGDMVIVAPV